MNRPDPASYYERQDQGVIYSLASNAEGYRVITIKLANV